MMRMRLGRAALAAATALGVVVGVGRPAEAAFVFTMEQQGSDVVLTGSGTIDTAGLIFQANVMTIGTGVNPIFGITLTAGLVAAYSGLTGPTNFGSGGFRPASSFSGDPVTLSPQVDRLYVPRGYVSDTSLSISQTFTGATFASLGVTLGTYIWTWGSGANADSLTLQIGPAAAVPEPATLALFGAGLLGLGMARRRKVALQP